MIQRPKGCHDIYGRDAKIWKYVDSIVDAVMEKYNYGYIRTPIFEASELYHRGVGEASDVVRKETYDFKDRGDRDLSLRPEGTAGIVRAYIEDKMQGDAQPVKLYYNGTMYRYERPQSGRDRELTQFGYEVLGSDDPLMDAEVISVAVNIFKMLGITNLTVHLNSLGDKESRDNYRDALVKHFKPHIDELCEDCKERLEKNPLRILDCKVDKDNKWLKSAPKITDYLTPAAKRRFSQVQEYLDILTVKYVVDPNCVRGLDYYNHTIFEVEVNSDVLGSNNILGGGGRYNDLVETLGGNSTPGIGFAAGVGRVVEVLKELNVPLDIREDIDLYLLYVNEEEKKYALYLANELRLAGFVVELENMGRSLKAQFRQAERLNAKYIAVLNSDDLNNNEIKLKNSKTKEEDLISLDAIIYYLDEKLNTESDLDYDDCGCGDECHCGNHCECGDDCHCGDHCECGDDCHCGDECHCEDHCECGDDCHCGDDCSCKNK